MDQLDPSSLEIGDDVHVTALDMKGYIQDKHNGRYGLRLGVVFHLQKNGKWEYETRWFFPHEISTSQYPIYRKIENKYGFKDCVDINDTDAYVPLCSQCHCCIMPNHGNGMMCDNCDYEFRIECEHDYREGDLF